MKRLKGRTTYDPYLVLGILCIVFLCGCEEQPDVFEQRYVRIEIPKYTMVVAPGRDLAIMVETAVRKCLLAQRGIEDERGFLESINLLAQGDDDDAS